MCSAVMNRRKPQHKKGRKKVFVSFVREMVIFCPGTLTCCDLPHDDSKPAINSLRRSLVIKRPVVAQTFDRNPENNYTSSVTRRQDMRPTHSDKKKMKHTRRLIIMNEGYIQNANCGLNPCTVCQPLDMNMIRQGKDNCSRVHIDLGPV